MDEIRKRLLARSDLRKLGVDKSNTTLLRWERIGRFPRRILIGGCSVVWSADEIEEWFKARSAERASRVYAEDQTLYSLRSKKSS
jgi:predicted DNA-binding transcriptional regulator AlpA